MKRLLATLLMASMVGMSCNTVKNIFEKKTPHETYADKLEDRGLEKTPEGRQWLAASQAALDQPQEITLPYKQIGHFPADKPRALGLRFTAKRGERLTFQLTRTGNRDLSLYADLFRQDGPGQTSQVKSSDTAAGSLVYDVETAGSYILRIQPELFEAGQYQLSVTVGPSLDFPVDYKKARVGSFWGADRDGGKRRHEGIDIFAPKSTPVVAADDGVVTAVQEGGLGGKVVWLRLEDRHFTLYYAHLDAQLVHQGQVVKKGHVLGTVGNTGNARTTPAHLHFGVYTSQGPVDPFPFVNREVRIAPDVPRKNMTEYLRLLKTQKGGEGTVKANTLLVPLAVHAKGYISELPDGTLIQTAFTLVKSSGQPVVKEAVVQSAGMQVRGS